MCGNSRRLFFGTRAVSSRRLTGSKNSANLGLSRASCRTTIQNQRRARCEDFTINCDMRRRSCAGWSKARHSTWLWMSGKARQILGDGRACCYRLKSRTRFTFPRDLRMAFYRCRNRFSFSINAPIITTRLTSMAFCGAIPIWPSPGDAQIP